jgi:hypothetical protein
MQALADAVRKVRPFQEVSLMSPYTLRLPASSSTSTNFISANSRMRQAIALLSALLITAPGIAQQPSPPPTNSRDSSPTADSRSNAIASVPAGTRLALVLTQPIQTRYFRRGDDVYAQIISPVARGKEVVIPAGTFVQGKFDKMERHGGRAELRLASLAITFPDGYVAPVSGPITLESDDGYALKDPGKGRVVSMFALPAAGLGLGTLIGHAAAGGPQTLTIAPLPGCNEFQMGCATPSLPDNSNVVKDTAIGAMVGLAVGGVAGLAIMLGTRNFYLDAGSPISMVLHQPITMPEDEVEDAIRDAEQHPAPEVPIAPPPQSVSPPDMSSDPGICYTPGTPGTPDVDIPGTPAIGDSPGTPAIHIPGIPPTPPTPHPCP